MAEGCSDSTSALEADYTKAFATLAEVNLQSLFPFFKEQGLMDETLLGVQSEEELKELFTETLQPFTSLWFQKFHGNIGNPRPFGTDVGDLFFYEGGSRLNAIQRENREVEFKSFKAPPPHVAPQNSELTWQMLEKAKDFICGCLNAERKGVIYFGVGDQDGEVLGLEIENMKDEIVTAYQDVLKDHITSDGGKSLSMGEQDCIKRYFIPVKREGTPTMSYVFEIEVARDWRFCKDNVYYSKTWKKKDKKKDNNNKVANLKALRDFFDVKPGEWNDAHVRTDGRTSSCKKEEVNQKVKIPLQVKFKEWKAKQDPNSLQTDSQMIAEQIVTEQQLADISSEVGTCWRKLAPKLGIDAVACELIDEDYRGRSAEKASQLLIKWKRLKGRDATVGRLADALENIGKKQFAEKLLGLCQM